MHTYKVGFSRGAIALALGLLAVSAFFISSQVVFANAIIVDPACDDTIVPGTCDDPNTYMTIAAAVAVAGVGDVITVAAGTYDEAVTISTGITLQGAGDDAVTGTILASTAAGYGVNIASSDVSLKNLRIDRAGFGGGISVAASGTTTNISLDGITVTNASNAVNHLAAPYVGFRVSGGTSIDGLAVTNSHFDSNDIGWYLSQESAAVGGPTVTNVTVSDTTFSNNLMKGIYAEKLDHATFTNVTVSDSGTDATYGFNAGIDINLKWSAYSDITIQNSTVTGSGLLGAATSPFNPASITIKARDDAPSYASPAASLSTVTLNNLTVTGGYNALRFGETNKANTGPTNVSVSNSTLTATNYALINATTTATVSADNNYWGTASRIAVLGKIAGAATVNSYYIDSVGGILATNPAVSITAGPQDPTAVKAEDVSFTFESTTPSATFEYTLSGITAPCTSPFSSTTLTSGSYTFDIVVTDPLTSLTGNISRAFTVDADAPTVTAVNSDTLPGTYKQGGIVTFSVVFSEAVTVTDTPTLALNTAVNPASATYTDGSGTDTLTFSYTVGPVTSGDLGYEADTSLSGTITDIAGNTATLTLPDPATFTAAHEIVVDGIQPTLTSPVSIPSPAKDGTPTFGFTSDEAGTIVVTGGGCLATTTAAVVGVNSFTFLSSTTPEIRLADGAYVCPIKVVDAAGNESNVLNTAEFRIDTTAPTVSVLSSTPAGSYNTGDPINLTLNFSEAIVASTDVYILLNNGRSCTATDHGPTPQLSCTYQIQSGDDVTDLSVVSIAATSSGQVTDTTGNVAVLTPTINMAPGIIIDTIAPVLTLGGSTPVSIIENQVYTDAGATADDSSTVLTSGTVNTGSVGTYTLTYNATDTAGNEAVALTRTVYVTVDPNATATTLATSTNPDTTVSGTIVFASTLGSTVELPAGVTVTGPSGWNGVINAPTATTTFTMPTPVSDLLYSSILAIEVGSDYPLTFDKGVRIVFPGKIGQFAGWSRNGVFTPITATCASDDQATGDALAAGADCKVNSGGNLVVWTKHFTQFVTYAVTPTGSGTGGSGGGGGGGNGPVAVSVPSTPSTGGGEVLGATTDMYVFTKNLQTGSTGADVTALQTLLIDEGYMTGEATGYYGTKTTAAVKLYQKAHGISQTGTVGPLTRAALNGGTSSSSSSSSSSAPTGTPALSKTQADAILGLLSSFGADQATIDNVKKALGY